MSEKYVSLAELLAKAKKEYGFDEDKFEDYLSRKYPYAFDLYMTSKRRNPLLDEIQFKEEEKVAKKEEYVKKLEESVCKNYDTFVGSLRMLCDEIGDEELKSYLMKTNVYIYEMYILLSDAAKRKLPKGEEGLLNQWAARVFLDECDNTIKVTQGWAEKVHGVSCDMNRLFEKVCKLRSGGVIELNYDSDMDDVIKRFIDVRESLTDIYDSTDEMITEVDNKQKEAKDILKNRNDWISLMAAKRKLRQEKDE